MARILIVDDDPDAPGALAHALRARGYHVRAATGTDAALTAIERRAPDLVVLHLRARGLEGARFLDELRRRGIRERTRVIVRCCGDRIGEGGVGAVADAVRAALAAPACDPLARSSRARELAGLLSILDRILA